MTFFNKNQAVERKRRIDDASGIQQSIWGI